MSQVRQFEDHHLPTYFNFLEWLERLPMKAAPAEQWIATILNAKGIREEEIQRSEIIHYLQKDTESGKKVQKRDVYTHAERALLRCRPVLVTERATEFRPSLHLRKFNVERIPPKIRHYLEMHRDLQCYEHPSLGYRLIGSNYGSLFGNRQDWIVLDDGWNLVTTSYCRTGCFRTSVDAMDAMYSHGRKRMASFSSAATVALRYLKSVGQERLESVRILELSPKLAAIVQSKGVPLFGWW